MKWTLKCIKQIPLAAGAVGALLSPLAKTMSGRPSPVQSQGSPWCLFWCGVHTLYFVSKTQTNDVVMTNRTIFFNNLYEIKFYSKSNIQESILKNVYISMKSMDGKAGLRFSTARAPVVRRALSLNILIKYLRFTVCSLVNLLNNLCLRSQRS